MLQPFLQIINSSLMLFKANVLNITEITANNIRLPSGYVEGELDLFVLVKKHPQKQVLVGFQALK